MDLTLTRNEWRRDGIFGEYTITDTGEPVAVTLEHAYFDGGEWIPKLAAGMYICTRHAPNKFKYETFLVEGVPPFQGKAVVGLLAGHKGNFNDESEGCVLIGAYVVKGNVHILSQSTIAFERFMALQNGVQQFTLTVRNET